MIKIGDKEFKAEQTIEVHHDTSVPVQPVETGFNVQDHVKHEPLTVKSDILIYNTEEHTLHGRWEWRTIDGVRTAVERTETNTSQGTYNYLIELRDSGEPFMLDCSDHAKEAAMIFPDMIISHLGQVVQKGGSYWCTVYFSQITKSTVSTEDFYIQEVDSDGESHIRWSRESLKEPNVEALVTTPENPIFLPVLLRVAPIVQVATVLSKARGIRNMYDSIIEWSSRR